MGTRKRIQARGERTSDPKTRGRLIPCECRGQDLYTSQPITYHLSRIDHSQLPRVLARCSPSLLPQARPLPPFSVRGARPPFPSDDLPILRILIRDFSAPDSPAGMTSQPATKSLTRGPTWKTDIPTNYQINNIVAERGEMANRPIELALDIFSRWLPLVGWFLNGTRLAKHPGWPAKK